MNSHHYSHQHRQRSLKSHSVARHGSGVSHGSVKAFTKYPSQLSETAPPVRTPSKKLSNSSVKSFTKYPSQLCETEPPTRSPSKKLSNSSVKSFTKYPSQLCETEPPKRTSSKTLSNRRSNASRQSSSRSLPEEQTTTLPIEKRWAPQMTAEGKFSFMKQTVVRRSGNLYTMDLQGKHSTQPMFAAEKDGQSSYIFRSIISNTVLNEHPVMGTLTVEKPKRSISKTHNNHRTVDFAVMHHDRSRAPYRTGTIHYDEKSLYAALKKSLKQQPQHIVFDCLDKGSFESKDAHQTESGGYALDFRGRGRESSRKNVQLQKDDGTVILQMVRWSKDEFHVDYQDPIDGFNAFAFALAQFERFSNQRKS